MKKSALPSSSGGANFQKIRFGAQVLPVPVPHRGGVRLSAETCSSACASGLEDFASPAGGLAGAEATSAGAFKSGRSVGWLHGCLLEKKD